MAGWAVVPGKLVECIVVLVAVAVAFRDGANIEGVPNHQEPGW